MQVGQIGGPWRSHGACAGRTAAALHSVLCALYTADTMCKVSHFILTVCTLRPHFVYKNTKSARVGYSLVTGVLPWHTEGPRFNPQHSTNPIEWHTPVIPEVKPDFRGHFPIHRESETSLGYTNLSKEESAGSVWER